MATQDAVIPEATESTAAPSAANENQQPVEGEREFIATTESPRGDATRENLPQPGFMQVVAENWFLFLIMIVLWAWVIYSFKNQKKRAEAVKDRLGSIKKDDKVITIGGLHGTVVATDEDTFTIKPDDKSSFTLTFERKALLRFKNEPEETKNP